MASNHTLPAAPDRTFVLGIDTCGSVGTVALGLWIQGNFELLGQTELAGRSYSSTLVTAVSDLLATAGAARPDAILDVNGPGSFTGVRVGLSAAKAFAEAWQIPLAVVSRLEVMTANSGEPAAALDAHRGEVFLRVRGVGGKACELLAGRAELTAMTLPPARIAVCDEAAAGLLASVWRETELVRTLAPTAAHALELRWPKLASGRFTDPALLDGHYLRRSDAEIFGAESAARSTAKKGA